MKTKALEIRDRCTFIAAMATKLESTDSAEIWLMWKSGYHPQANESFVILTHLGRGEGHIDPYQWVRDSRTMMEAHKYIVKNFDKLKTGDVIDVEFILGEVKVPKVSERESRRETLLSSGFSAEKIQPNSGKRKTSSTPVDRYPND